MKKSRRRRSPQVSQELIYEAAWLHFVRHEKQTTIGKRLGVTKFVVNRWLRKARQAGLIQVRLVPQETPQLTARFREEFPLRHLRILPSLSPRLFSDATRDAASEEGRTAQYEILGEAAAALCRELIEHAPQKSGGPLGLGLGGGTGVAALVRHLALGCPRRSLEIFALSVSNREPFSLSASSLTAIATSLVDAELRTRRNRLANLESRTSPVINGHALRLPARDQKAGDFTEQAEDYYDKACRRLDLVFTGIGDIDHSWILNEREQESIRKNGGVGDILYDVYDKNGETMHALPTAAVYPFRIRRLQELVKQGRDVVAICAGKPHAIYHALRAPRLGFLTGLVTDAATAEAVLALATPETRDDSPARKPLPFAKSRRSKTPRSRRPSW